MGAGADRGQEFGVLLRQRRRLAGLTQEELAHLSGVSVRAISDMERGRTSRPFMHSIRRIADAMTLSGDAREQLTQAAQLGASDAHGSAGPVHPARSARRSPRSARSARDFPATVQREPAAGPPRQLPPAVRRFAGRATELAALYGLLDQRGASSRALAIAAISGTAGVGKTALAVHWAHQVAARFPDGQLYADMQGFCPAGAPLAPIEALRSFLDALAVPQSQRPARPQDQAGLFRTILAERAMLVVLDNARDAEQVRLLLPGSPTCLVLVTSRTELSGLAATHGARLLPVDVLSAAEARELMAGRLGTERVAAQESATAELIELCARLPLALGIAAARAAARPGIPLAALTSELRGSPERLDALDTGDTLTDMRAVLSWSLRNLSAPTARMFRVLGLHPGPDVSIRAAASLADLPLRAARRLLNDLAHAGLAREHSHGRFTCHDLLRTYAAELASATDDGWDAAERRKATGRMLDYYLHAAHAAARLLAPRRQPLALTPPQPGVTAESLADRGEALAWFEAERSVLLAVTEQAAELRFDLHAWQLPWVLASFLDMQGHWQDWLTTQHIALAAAQRLGDRIGQAHAHRNIGCAYLRFDSHETARTHLRQAASLFGQLDDALAVAQCWLNIAHTFELQRRYGEALYHATRALEVTRAAGDPPCQAASLNAIGWCHLQLGDYDAALASCQQALGLHRTLGDRRSQAADLDSIGYAQLRIGRLAQAIACCDQAAELNRELGDRAGESEALIHLGDAYQAANRPDAAREAWQRALVILDDLYHPGAGELRNKLSEAGSDAPPIAG
jgi:tetratricopeptide (TPR) repeat protein/transcriptional regulator with XRE-family HTH domain